MARFRDERLRKVSPATVKRDLSILPHLFEVARKEWGVYVQNPVRDIKRRFHDRRHEATTRLFEKGFNIMEVASVTDHKDLRMLRRYTHLKGEDLARTLG